MVAFSTEDLLDELRDRFQHCIFAGCKDVPDEKMAYKRSYKGNVATCCGLATLTVALMARDWEEQSEEIK